MANIKTSLVIPEDIYRELKKRAAEENRSIKSIVIEALIEYLSKSQSSRETRRKLIEIITSPVEGAGPEDYKEYDYEDLD
ncbi:MAG: hypothetical protein DRN04_03585 [Thermoprotei archaeon]|nr:MAG: hypothetical protein DRN04_03585 [Thermoprotei archaeon]